MNNLCTDQTFNIEAEHPMGGHGTQLCDDHLACLPVLEHWIGIPTEFHEKVFGLFNTPGRLSGDAVAEWTPLKRSIGIHDGRT